MPNSGTSTLLNDPRISRVPASGLSLHKSRPLPFHFCLARPASSPRRPRPPRSSKPRWGALYLDFAAPRYGLPTPSSGYYLVEGTSHTTMSCLALRCTLLLLLHGPPRLCRQASNTHRPP